ncbi:MAG: corrinoid protein [Desulfobacterales bacterium]|jgi:5-methyltetrahydrofolate--homocysteine methyltransferase
MSYQTLLDAVIKGDIKTAKEETLKAVDAGQKAQDILDQGLIEAMNVVGDKFSKGAIFVPQMLRSAKTMQECVEVLKPHFQDNAMTTKGNIVLGTVKGDLHDIGKNLVGMMLEGAGFNIIDLGVDVAPEVFVNKIKESKADILGMSALLSTTMPSMAKTIKALMDSGQRDHVKVIIGGAPVTRKFAEDIGADSYAPDAGAAVLETKKLLNIT